jgi:hypothetical protein
MRQGLHHCEKEKYAVIPAVRRPNPTKRTPFICPLISSPYLPTGRILIRVTARVSVCISVYLFEISDKEQDRG